MYTLRLDTTKHQSFSIGFHTAYSKSCASRSRTAWSPSPAKRSAFQPSSCSLPDATHARVATTATRPDPARALKPRLPGCQKRLSGPILDRIDMHISVQRVEFDKLTGPDLGESSAVVRQRVTAARERQWCRFAEHPAVGSNAEMRIAEIRFLATTIACRTRAGAVPPGTSWIASTEGRLKHS